MYFLFLFFLFSFENFESVFGIRIYAVWGGGGVKGVKHLSLSIGSVDWLLELSKVNRKILRNLTFLLALVQG